MGNHEPRRDRPRGRALDPHRAADHLLVHQYIRVLGRRPTVEELAEGKLPHRVKGRAGRLGWVLRGVLPRHAARLVALLAPSRA